MTYNFDPDRWYDNELAYLDHHLKTDRLTPRQYEKARDDLQERYDAMLARLDGTYRIGSGAADRGHQTS